MSATTTALEQCAMLIDGETVTREKTMPEINPATCGAVLRGAASRKC